MWIEGIFTKEDIERILTRAMPITIEVDDAGNHVTLSELAKLELVPDLGLRVECAASVLWTVLGIHVPITLHAVTVLLRPKIVKGAHGDALAFGLVIEHADFAGIPTVIDDQLTDKINAALEAEHLDLSWAFSETLSGSFPLPPSLRPLDTLSLQVAWGKLRVTDEAFVMAISFHSDVTRHEGDAVGAPATEPEPRVASEPVVPPEPAVAPAIEVERAIELRWRGRDGASRSAEIAAIGAAGLVLGVSIYSAFRLGTRHARRARLDAWLLR